MYKRFVVIGSNSFSGSNLTRYLLQQGHQVLGVSRSAEPDAVFLPYKIDPSHPDLFEFFQGDLNIDYRKVVDLIRDFSPEYVVNFAAQGMVAQSWDSPEDWYQTNVVAQVRLHDA